MAVLGFSRMTYTSLLQPHTLCSKHIRTYFIHHYHLNHALYTYIIWYELGLQNMVSMVRAYFVMHVPYCSNDRKWASNVRCRELSRNRTFRLTQACTAKRLHLTKLSAVYTASSFPCHLNTSSSCSNNRQRYCTPYQLAQYKVNKVPRSPEHTIQICASLREDPGRTVRGPFRHTYIHTGDLCDNACLCVTRLIQLHGVEGHTVSGGSV